MSYRVFFCNRDYSQYVKDRSDRSSLSPYNTAPMLLPHLFSREFSFSAVTTTPRFRCLFTKSFSDCSNLSASSLLLAYTYISNL